MRWWIKVDADFHSNPRVLAAGRYGREVFFLLLCLNGKHDLGGEIPAKYVMERALAAQLQFSNPAQVADGIAGCKEAGLIEVKPNGDVAIVGWTEEWAPRPSSSAQRSALYRKRHVTNRDASVTDGVTFATGSSHPVTEETVTKRDADVTVKRDERVASRGSEILDLDLRDLDLQKSGKVARRSATAPANPDHQVFVDWFTELFAEHRGGARCTWSQPAHGQVKRLLKAHGLAEVQRRARIMFEAPPAYLARGGLSVMTLAQKFDEFAAPSLPVPAVRKGRDLGVSADEIRAAAEAARAQEAEGFTTEPEEFDPWPEEDAS